MNCEEAGGRNLAVVDALASAAIAIDKRADQMDEPSLILEASLATISGAEAHHREVAEILDRTRVHQRYLRELARRLSRLAAIADRTWSAEQEREFLIYCNAVQDQLAAQLSFGREMLRAAGTRRPRAER